MFATSHVLFTSIPLASRCSLSFPVPCLCRICQSFLTAKGDKGSLVSCPEAVYRAEFEEAGTGKASNNDQRLVVLVVDHALHPSIRTCIQGWVPRRRKGVRDTVSCEPSLILDSFVILWQAVHFLKNVSSPMSFPLTPSFEEYFSNSTTTKHVVEF